MSSQRKGWKIPEWGDQYGFSRAKSYAIIASGEGPATARIGKTKIITEEADKAWRRRLNQAAEVEAAA